MVFYVFRVKRISEKTIGRYALGKGKDGYAIQVVERDMRGFTVDKCTVKGITYDTEQAYRIFDLTVENAVCACTLYDVISDLIC